MRCAHTQRRRASDKLQECGMWKIFAVFSKAHLLSLLYTIYLPGTLACALNALANICINGRNYQRKY